MDCPLEKLLPCMQKWYKGASNYKKNHCLEKNKCEYLNGIWNFIFQCYPEYVVTDCCDTNNNKSYPEAILTNLENNSTIAIEMKCFPDKVYENVHKTENINKKEATFWKKIIDQCAINAKNQLKEYLNKFGMEDNSCIEQLFSIIFYGMNIRIISKGKENVQTILMKYKYSNKQMEFVTNSIFSFSLDLLKNLNSKKDLSLIDTFENDELKVIIYLSKNDTVYFEIHDNSVIGLHDIDKINEDGITDYLKKFFKGCEKKFLNVTADKNILLLDNNFFSYKRDEVIQKCLKNLPVPSCIDEIWICKKKYEDEYDEDGCFDYTYLSDVSYQKIY